MILPGPAIRALLSGERVQLCRPAAGETCTYEPGDAYPVHSRARGPLVTRARVVAVRRVTLDELTEEDARAQGYEDLETLYGLWRDKYRDGPLTRPPVWVVELRVDVEERARFLRPRSGYTNDPREAIPDEPEALSAADLERYSQEAVGRLNGRWRAVDRERRRLELHDRYAVLREEARMRGVNISQHERVIARRLDAIEDQLRAARGERAA